VISKAVRSCRAVRGIEFTEIRNGDGRSQADRGPADRELSRLTEKHVAVEAAMRTQGLRIVNSDLDVIFCYLKNKY